MNMAEQLVSETAVFRSYLEALVRAATLAQHLDLCETRLESADALKGELGEACWPSGRQAEPSELARAEVRHPGCKVTRIGGG